MKPTRTAALVAALALLGSVFAAAGPASAVAMSFDNSPTLVTAQDTTDLDILSMYVERTPTNVELKLTTENVPFDNYEITGYFLRSGADFLSPSVDAVIITLTKQNGVTGPLAVQSRIGGVLSPLNVGAGSTVAPTNVELSVSPSAMPWAGDIWGGARITVGGVVKEAGVSFGGSVGGFGPVNALSIPTTTTLAGSSGQQLFGQTSVTLTSTVSPGAAGSVEIFDGTISLAVLNVTPDLPSPTFAIPNTLAIGDHTLHAVFTPQTAQYAISTSTDLKVQVIDPNAKPAPTPVAAKVPIKTSIKLTLSKDKQHFKGKSAKLTVRVSGKHAGKVRIYDGTRKIKTLKLTAGKASYTLSSKLTKRTHKLTAVYVPTDPTSFASSTSKKVSLRVVK